MDIDGRTCCCCANELASGFYFRSRELHRFNHSDVLAVSTEDLDSEPGVDALEIVLKQNQVRLCLRKVLGTVAAGQVL